MTEQTVEVKRMELGDTVFLSGIGWSVRGRVVGTSRTDSTCLVEWEDKHPRGWMPMNKMETHRDQ